VHRGGETAADHWWTAEPGRLRGGEATRSTLQVGKAAGGGGGGRGVVVVIVVVVVVADTMVVVSRIVVVVTA